MGEGRRRGAPDRAVADGRGRARGWEGFVKPWGWNSVGLLESFKDLLHGGAVLNTFQEAVLDEIFNLSGALNRYPANKKSMLMRVSLQSPLRGLDNHKDNKRLKMTGAATNGLQDSIQS
jgi:hypothetical protein